MTLKDEWDRLGSATRGWLMENPGCVLVPHAVTVQIQKASTGHIEVDGHGQMILSREDLDFVRAKRSGAGPAQVGEEFRFFDAAQPREPG